MSKYSIGIDPGSNRHGVAVYEDGTLAQLAMLSTAQLVELLRGLKGNELVIAVEDVQANKPIYARNDQKTRKAQGKVGQNIGQNKQAQRALCERLDEEGFKYRVIRPSRSNWAQNRPYFERITGWRGNSNKDTRSAAYFGFLVMNFGGVR